MLPCCLAMLPLDWPCCLAMMPLNWPCCPSVGRDCWLYRGHAAVIHGAMLHTQQPATANGARGMTCFGLVFFFHIYASRHPTIRVLGCFMSWCRAFKERSCQTLHVWPSFQIPCSMAERTVTSSLRGVFVQLLALGANCVHNGNLGHFVRLSS